MKNSKQETALKLWYGLPHAAIWCAWFVMCVGLGYSKWWASIIPALPLITALLLAWESPPSALPFSLIGTGFIYDLLAGQPLGITPLLWAGIYCWHLKKLRPTHADEPFFSRWISIGSVLVFATLIELGLAWFLSLNIPSFAYIFMRLLFTLLLIPPIAWLIAKVRQRTYRRLWVFLPPEVKPL
jgi:rod shape-determining protein MreD